MMERRCKEPNPGEKLPMKNDGPRHAVDAASCDHDPATWGRFSTYWNSDKSINKRRPRRTPTVTTGSWRDF